MNQDRDWAAPEYKAWRLAIYKRDKFCCRMPNCQNKRRKIQAHHIKKWTTFPELRFDVNNGITLCKYHHSLVNTNEESYEQLFSNLLSGKTDCSNRVKALLYG